MKELKKKFNVAVEDLPVIAGFLCTSFESNQADFTNFSPDYQDPYLASYKAKLALVDEIIFPKKIGAEIKLINERIIAALKAMRGPLNKLERYAAKAKNLSVNPEDFGIKAVRAAISRKDFQNFFSEMSNLNSIVDTNFAALNEKGFKQEAKDFLVEARKNVKADMDLQNTKMNSKADLVEANIEMLNELWELMNDLAKTGKSLYNDTDISKTAEFTLEQLKKRVKKERKKKENITEGTGDTPPA